MTRYEIMFTGRVQGVGFRYTTCRVASRFEVAGWVRNESDGSVRCVAEGAHDELDRFVAAVQEAMAGYRHEAAVRAGAATGEFTDFSVRRSVPAGREEG